jgi:hypothetical protein
VSNESFRYRFSRHQESVFMGPVNLADGSGVAAVSVIPGAFFSGGMDGILRAVSPGNGQPLWEFDTAQEFETVNGVKAKGGSIGAAGL